MLWELDWWGLTEWAVADSEVGIVLDRKTNIWLGNGAKNRIMGMLMVMWLIHIS